MKRWTIQRFDRYDPVSKCWPMTNRTAAIKSASRIVRIQSHYDKKRGIGSECLVYSIRRRDATVFYSGSHQVMVRRLSAQQMSRENTEYFLAELERLLKCVRKFDLFPDQRETLETRMKSLKYAMKVMHKGVKW